MITITNVGNSYNLKFSEPSLGWKPIKAKARDWAEVHTALDHWEGLKHDDTTCPLCRWEDKESKR